MILPVLFPFFSLPPTLLNNRWHYHGLIPSSSMRNVIPQQNVSNSLERPAPWRNGKTCCRLEAGQKTRGVGSSLPSPSGPLSVFLLLLPPHPPPPPFCSSAPPHPLFMSAWIAPFHYIQLPAHYQSHHPSPSPSMCFYFHDDPQWG